MVVVVTAVFGLVAKVVLWAETVGDVLVEALAIDSRVDVEPGVCIIVVTAVMIALEFAVKAPQSAYVALDVLINALTDVTIGVMHGSGVDVLADVNVGTFVVVMTALEFTMPTALEGCSC